MPILSIENLLMHFGPDVLFDSLQCKIYPSEKVGLVGPNGCGKTTLLKLILKQLNHDLGDIKIRKKTRIAYLPQQPVFDDSKTVIELLHSGAAHILELQNKINRAAENIANHKGDDQLQ